MYDDVASRVVEELVVETWPWSHMVNATRCGTLFRAKHTQICQFKANRYATWCTKTANFNLVKWSMQSVVVEGLLQSDRFVASQGCASNFSEFRVGECCAQVALTAAWHLRVGDILPDRRSRDLFVNVFGELQEVARMQGVPVDPCTCISRGRGQNEQCDIAAGRLPICRRKRVPRRRQLCAARACGSDRGAAGRRAYVRRSALQRGIVLFETPKENCDVCYYVSEAFRVDTSGRIFDVAEFRARMKMFFRSSHLIITTAIGERSTSAHRQ